MNYWLAIVGNIEQVKFLDKHLWWCVPKDASKNDNIFMYCPRKLGEEMHGIFALCRIKEGPHENHYKNRLCYGYGGIFGGKGTLRYVELEIVKKYTRRLTAKEIKSDNELAKTSFSGRNFQGTTFSLVKNIYERLHFLIEMKQTNSC
jgi:hypothetical protein